MSPWRTDVRLIQDKTAVITGAATGIGKATAFKFAEHGARLIIADIDEKGVHGVATELGKKNVEVHSLTLDLAIMKSVGFFLEEVNKLFEHIDILVNNAGRFSTVPIPEMTEDEWDKVMDVNLKGTFFLSQKILM